MCDTLSDFTVVIPTLNEESAIESVIKELIDNDIPLNRILVVDGHSTDRTVEKAINMGVKVVEQEGFGKANAIMTALKHVKTRWMVVMDGDYTYPAKYVKVLLRMACEDYDEVIGARRWLEPGSQGLIYRIGNKLLTSMFNLLFDTKLTDVLSGMYVVNTELLRYSPLNVRGFSVEAGIAAHVASMGRITEVPIEYRRRIGKKKLHVKHGIGIFADMIRLSWNYNPTFTLLFLASLIFIPGLVLGAYVGYEYLFFGIKYYVKGIIAIIMFMTGIQLFATSILSLFIKRMEYRINRLLRGVFRK
ncbi:glycosyltransferase family 2 protein [Vulcanisaeta thermophila]|uniref:glycosyltransferase family 2 protein n=1 Tax=Vulcanisaeta thermophila TaxID=867917 RepID=UPI000853454D|nr:glycosyltransferase family 2 protein [Vulcanisaeta thermophila]